VDADGTIVALPGKLPGAEGSNLRAFLESRFGMPASVRNDAVAFGAGEAVHGAGRGLSRVVVVTIGTGVGVTVFEGGGPMGEGVLGGGILGGQVPIAEEGGPYEDTSGRTGSIEALCRADRVVDYMRDAGGTATTPVEVFAALEARDPAAIAGLARYRLLLTRALVALAHAHAPDILVVGGGPAGAESPLLDGVEDAVNRRLFGNYRTRVRLSQAGDAAALFGLAELAGRAAG
jgi:glucokinase